MTRLPTLAPRLPGNSNPVIEPGPKEHTEAEWEAKRALIQKLYIQDNRKLSETMSILQSKHAFSATEQMYKKRLKKWNIRKRIYRKSQTPTEASTPSTNSPAAKSEDSGVEEIQRTTEPEQTAVSIVQPANTGPYTGLEIVLGSVFSWSQSKLENPLVVSDPMSRYLANPSQPPMQDSRTMYRTFELVFDLWKHGKGDLAGMAARKGFYVLEYVLTEDHPDLVWHMLDTIYDMVNSGHIQLLKMFLEHASVLAYGCLPPQHPLLQILFQLRKCDFETDQGRQYVCHLLRQAWLRNVDILSDQIGSLAPQHLWLYEQLIWDGRTPLRKNSDLRHRKDVMIDTLKQLIANQELTGEDSDSEKLRMEALLLEFTQMDLGDKKMAEQLARQLLEHTQDSAGAKRSNARFQAYARKMLARISEDRCEFAAAEENLKWAINRREAAHGADNNLRVVRDMWVLQRYFQRVGRQAEADQVAGDAIARATRYLDDIPG